MKTVKISNIQKQITLGIFILLSLNYYVNAQETELIELKFPNTKLISERFTVLKTDMNVKHGEYQRFNRKGEILETGAFKFGVKEGNWTYSRQGEPKYSGEYKENKKVGVWRTEKIYGDIKIYEGWDFDIDTSVIPLINFPLRYPQEAIEKGLTGVVFYSFIINSDCSISDVTILRSPANELNSAIFEGLYSIKEKLSTTDFDCSQFEDGTKITQTASFVL